MLAVFAVDDTTAQVHWSGLASGRHELAIGDRPVVVDAAVGAHTFTALAPATRYGVTLDGRRRATFTTLPALAGPVSSRIATISDLHIGEPGFGFFPRIASDGRHAERATRAALTEAVAWGADLIVVKGDISHYGRAREYEAFNAILRDAPVPVVVMPGNHDGGDHVHGNFSLIDGGERVDDVVVRDLPGIRVVAFDSVRPRHKRGRVFHVIDQVTAATREADEHDTAALVLLHHPPERTLVVTHPPSGLLGLEAFRLLHALADANPRTLVSAGHSHRHRRRRHRSVVVTEVGSVKDFPGTWAGYTVHEGGIVQVVRRIADPEVIAWTQRTGTSVLGMWGRYAPGRLHDRCFSHNW
ncbi:MAG: metallophosphoesterase [Acidimicrobiia bacterium]